jgi:hypothetical protein
MSREQSTPFPHKKLSITISYENQKELSRMLFDIKNRVGHSSICHEETFKGGNYSYTVEDLQGVNILSDFNILEEPDMLEVTPRIEKINGKTCHVYVSKMNFNVV